MQRPIDPLKKTPGTQSNPLTIPRRAKETGFDLEVFEYRIQILPSTSDFSITTSRNRLTWNNTHIKTVSVSLT